jgi:hypothetical protein
MLTGKASGNVSDNNSAKKDEIREIHFSYFFRMSLIFLALHVLMIQQRYVADGTRFTRLLLAGCCLFVVVVSRDHPILVGCEAKCRRYLSSILMIRSLVGLTTGEKIGTLAYGGSRLLKPLLSEGKRL